MDLKKPITALASLLVVGVLATAALAGPNGSGGLTGVWSGKTHQDIAPLAEDADFVEWEQRITVRAYKGRLISLATNVRYTCPDPTNPMAGDQALYLKWRVGRGPLLTPGGGFTLVITKSTNFFTGRTMKLRIPVQMTGVLGTGGGGGRFDLSRAGCSGKGSWQARRTSSI